jgi:GNAT superfamily N-acetyltransferase
MIVGAPRRMTTVTAEDLDSLVALTEHVDWPHTRDDWSDFLACGRVWGHRDADGRLVSCCALFEYSAELASIGLMIVRSEERGKGLAGLLMRRCIDEARAAVLSLIATPFGLPVYEHLGFRIVDEVARLTGRWREPPEPLPDLVPTAILSALGTPDRDAAVALDAEAYGAPRSDVVGRLAARASATSGAWLSPARLSGFALAVPKRGMTQITPVIAPDVATAYALIATLARQAAGLLRVDVPRGHEALIIALQRSGLAIARVDPVLTLGGKSLPGMRERIHGIGFQAFG